jgi:hypothetical protein
MVSTALMSDAISAVGSVPVGSVTGVSMGSVIEPSIPRSWSFAGELVAPNTSSNKLSTSARICGIRPIDITAVGIGRAGRVMGRVGMVMGSLAEVDLL